MTDLILSPVAALVLDKMREAVTLMSNSRKAQPGGFLLSPAIHKTLLKAAQDNGLSSDPKAALTSLLGLPFVVIDKWSWGWTLQNERWWRERIRQT